MTLLGHLSVEASAEVIPGTPATRKLAAVKALCARFEETHLLVPPSEILKIIEAEDAP